MFDNLVVTDLPGTMPGDFNDSGTVDAADIAQWQADFGVNADSDADGDGDSDGDDFWRGKNVGNTGASGAAAAVPEPATTDCGAGDVDGCGLAAAGGRESSPPVSSPRRV